MVILFRPVESDPEDEWWNDLMIYHAAHDKWFFDFVRDLRRDLTIWSVPVLYDERAEQLKKIFHRLRYDQRLAPCSRRVCTITYRAMRRKRFIFMRSQLVNLIKIIADHLTIMVINARQEIPGYEQLWNSI